ncbi:MAG: aldehyde ferredoxin oxidoreductase family protein [Chloroflexi bacterium]|nr:aldehyde ferredoxin oxidoreductase family protein [Chloroflexota bacterium]
MNQDPSLPTGYAGRILLVDLENRTAWSEPLAADDALKLIGGYGIGAKFLYLHQPGGVDPLGPENWLGFTTGPLTGSSIPMGSRWAVVTKSPLTGTWGDANAGGWFGHQLKAAGYDAIYCRGVADRPVYLEVNEGQVTFHDAGHLWGKDTYETDSALKSLHGRDAEIACIGQAGENRSLIAGIVHARERVAGRSGVGAVMGAKQLKAVVVRGKLPIQVGRATAAAKRKYVGQTNDGVGYSRFYQTTGTPGAIVGCIEAADAPIRNWAGSPSDFPEAERIGADALYRPGRKKRTCWGCPIACWGDVYQAGELVPQPEYETAAAFGPMQLVTDLQAILRSNDLCNRYGLDTISTGSTIAFAMECYERGLIGEHEIGFPLPWGDGHAAARLVEMMALRQGFGAVLADGSRQAAQRIGRGSEAYAMHVLGQDLPMHDPRLEPGLGLVYVADATPGRHNQAGSFLFPEDLPVFLPDLGEGRRNQVGRGKAMKTLAAVFHVVQAAGACHFGYLATTVSYVGDALAAVTGHPYTFDEVLLCGERIANLRQAFNVREGVNLTRIPLPARPYGRPPLTDGPTAGSAVQLELMLDEYLDAMGWDHHTAAPNERRLRELGLNFVAEDLPEPQVPTGA